MIPRPLIRSNVPGDDPTPHFHGRSRQPRLAVVSAKRSTSARLSRGKSEYSRTMSSYDMPSAKHARMNDAEKRVPRIVGLPPRRSRFVTRYRYPGIGVSSMMSSGYQASLYHGR